MEWIEVKNKPKENGTYMCFVPDCKHYNTHWAEYYWNGVNFIDKQAYFGNGRIVEATHYMIIVEPNIKNCS